MMKKRLMALAVACAVAVGTVPMMSFASDGGVTLDGLLGNELSNGTFESGLDGWTAGDGVTLSLDADNTHNNSAKAMKLEGSGSVSTSAKLYKQETYDVSLWVKPADESVTVTVKVGDKTVIQKIISEGTLISGAFKDYDTTTYSYKGYEIASASYDISVEITGACYIDDVLVKEAEEKIIPAKSSDSLGAWFLRNTAPSTGTAAMEYDSENSALKFSDTYKSSNSGVQLLAMKNGSKYIISFDVKLLEADGATKALTCYAGINTSSNTINSANIGSGEWYTFSKEFDCTYPTGGAAGTRAGTWLALGGYNSNSDYLIKNVSVKEVKTETKYNAPSVSVTAEKGDTVTPVVTPGVDDGDTAYYMYRYIANGTAADTGFGEDVPSYTVPTGFTGTLSLVVTPVNSQGTYGETQTVDFTYDEPQIVNNGVDDLDNAIGNKILKGTFDNGMPADWEYSEGVALERDLDNTVENSVASAKVSGIEEKGTIVISGTAMDTLYAEQAYEMSLWVKPLDSSKPLDVSVKAAITGTERDPLASAAVAAGTEGWTKVSGKVSRFSGGNSNKEAKVLSAEQVSFTISLSADCYVDEVMLKPADNYVTEENVKLNGSASVAEVNGWTLKNAAKAEDAGSDGLKASVSANQTNSLMQGVVLEKGSAYRMTAEVKKQPGSENDKLKLYLGYTAASKTVTLTDDWQTVTFDLTADVTNSKFSFDKVGSSVYIGANGTDAAADLYIKNVTVTKIRNFNTAPQVPVAVLPSSVLSGENAEATAELSFENGDAAGLKYVYKLNGKALTAGYASKETEIPSCTVPSSAEAGSKLTLTLIAVNTEGLTSAPVTSNECNVLKSFTITPPEVSASQITGGNTLNLSVNVANNTEKTENIAVIAAYFESEIMKACCLDEKAVTPKGNTDYDVSLTLPESISGNGELRIFVWKGYDGQTFLMEPVSEVITPVK